MRENTVDAMIVGLANILKDNIFYNVELARKVGVNAAVTYEQLVIMNHFREKIDGYFECTVADLEEATTLNEYHQRKALKTLKDEGMADYKVMKAPARRYVKLL